MDRRRFLSYAGVGAGATALAYRMASHDDALAAVSARFHGEDMLGQDHAAPIWYRYKFIGQAVMDNQLMFWLGLAPTGLTDIGEVLDTATRIEPGDERSWFEAWLSTAARVRGYGDEALARGHAESAALHYYRAGAYYRAGLMRYARRDDGRLVEATRTALALHDLALQMRGVESRSVEIPYEGSTGTSQPSTSPSGIRASIRAASS